MRSTRRSRSDRASSLTLVLALGAAVSGCTLVGGEPWGEVALSGEVRFTPPDTRFGEDGMFYTSKDYALDLTTLRLTPLSVDIELDSADGAEGAASFDPANPPAGYSLCHNGHCHADDGRLVDYEDIVLEGEAGGSSFRVERAASGVLDLLREERHALLLSPCDAECELPRSAFTSSAVTVGRLEVEALVVDRRPPETARLHENGVFVRIDTTMNERLADVINGAIDDTSAPNVDVLVKLRVPTTLLDGIDFGALLGSEPLSGVHDLSGFLSVSEAIRSSFIEDAEVEADVDEVEQSWAFEMPTEAEIVWWNEGNGT